MRWLTNRLQDSFNNAAIKFATHWKERRPTKKPPSKAQLADAQKKAAAIIEKANLTARQEHDAAVAETKKEIEKMKQTAKAEIQNERDRAFDQMKSQIVSLSLAAAGKIVSKNLDSKENDKLVSEFIGSLNKDMFADAR